MNRKKLWNGIALAIGLVLCLTMLQLLRLGIEDQIWADSAMREFHDNTSFFVTNGTVDRELDRVDNATSTLLRLEQLNLPLFFRKEIYEVRRIQQESFAKAAEMARDTNDRDDKIYCNLVAMRSGWDMPFSELRQATVNREKRILSQVSVGTVSSVDIKSDTYPAPPGWRPRLKAWWEKLQFWR
jgi:hypothetical protein